MARIIRLSRDLLQVVAEVALELAAGGLAVIPTDTVYGIAAPAASPRALEHVYRLKERDPSKQLVVMAGSMSALLNLADSRSYLRLLKLAPAWPGPLTVVAFRSADPILEFIAPGATIGLRIPDNPFTLALLKATGPLAVTSANPSGRPAPVCFDEVDASILEGVAVAVDAGACVSGEPSTILDITGPAPCVLRDGPLGRERLGEIMGEDIARIGGGEADTPSGASGTRGGSAPAEGGPDGRKAGEGRKARKPGEA